MSKYQSWRRRRAPANKARRGFYRPGVERLEDRTLLSNAIVTENQLPGTPESTWQVSGAGDPSLLGFAADISVNHGQTVSFKIDDYFLALYHIDIYRMGYYQGNGARLVASIPATQTTRQVQPAPLTDSATGLVDAGNWSVSASWAVPSTAVSGIYMARLTRDDTGGASMIYFVVRADDSHSDLLFQTSDSTWQAYNNWDGSGNGTAFFGSGGTYGGVSLYTYNGSNPTLQNEGRAYKVSYNRPLVDDATSGGYGDYNSPLHAEYPMVRFLEANGYDVSYSTDLDSDRNGALIKNHKAFLSVGHDEYWSGGQRANVTAARDAGVNLAFFSGNESFWKTRWEASIDGSGTPYRTLVCYKESKDNTPTDPLDASPTWTWTGTWRDSRYSPPADGGKPENALSGTAYMNDRTNVDLGISMTVPAIDASLRFWRNTAVANLQAGQTATLSQYTVGYETDEDVDNGSRPAGLMDMSATTFSTEEHVTVPWGTVVGPGSSTHSITLYRAASGALVFAAGSVQWSWGLDSHHNDSASTPDASMQQATVNLLADMKAQPGSLQSGLVAATASTDTTAPTSVITAPTGGASLQSGSTVTVSGTAADAGGGVVAGVEVSVDGGATWHPAVLAAGRTGWTYTWVPNAIGSVTVKSRAVDDSGNLETPSAGVTVNVAGPMSIFGTGVPYNPADSDSSSIEVGVKFRSDVAGYVTGVRFYKGSTNTGTHVGTLWTGTGTKLASATFTGETASGWQQVNFASAVAISANTTYVVSYHAPRGHYAGDDYAFTNAGYNSGPLHALANGVDGPNGVYAYSSGTTFPTSTFASTNYWVDVLFTTTANDTTPPTVTAETPAPNATGVSTTTTVTATFSEPVQPSTISFVLKDSSNNTVASTVSYNSSTNTATLTPNAALANAATYTATVSGAKDLAGNAMTSPVTWSFTTVGGPVANNDSYSTLEERALSVAAPGVLANDTDPSGYSLTAVLLAGPAHGTLTLNADGSFTYTPAAAFAGSDGFTYQARDPFGALSNVATVTITVAAPTLSINDVRANSGSSVTTFTFTVTLSSAISQAVTVNYATADGTAMSPIDYLSATGTLTFAPGQTSQTIGVTVNAHPLPAADKTFFVNLSAPSNATIARGTGTGTIVSGNLLQLDGPAVAPGPDVQPLTQGALAPVVAEATALWAAAGANTAALRGIDIRIADLPGTDLGAEAPGVIWIDVNAAGHGWFTDANPADPVPAGRVDLLTAVGHELGHALGLDHDDQGVMQETLPVGARHPIGAAALATAADAPTAAAVSGPMPEPLDAAGQLPASPAVPAGGAAAAGPASVATPGNALLASIGGAVLGGAPGGAVLTTSSTAPVAIPGGALTAGAAPAGSAAALNGPEPGAGPGSVWGPAMDTGGSSGEPLADGAALDPFFVALGNAVDDPGLLLNDSLGRST